ncbi:aminoglycoside phosphotransferase family protein [Jiangella anatolica]|uniref:Hydroxyurea phosphotransferase n=1 Tax=Jiangella anatolica TaxID=2670374 RepID=A0A2W2B9K9_9ACTN|nr:aminoglycoside phosphotransferase family protein [Jiangella anatolica]PZF81830.1 hydroxyurea phosphotransferase [Jiangella anatolica]
MSPDAAPAALVTSYGRDDAGRAWLAELPRLLAHVLQTWELRPDGPAGNGMAALVQPVVRADGTPAVLRLQPDNEESAAAVIGLRTWSGDGVVRLLAHDGGAMLLERLDGDRPLSSLPSDDAAMTVLGELLARLVAVPAPDGLPRLSEVAAAMVADAPAAAPSLADPAERRLVQTCAAAVADLLPESGDRLLHWDLHDENVLAGEREPWLAIDPVPLAGDPGFDLWPALNSRWPAAIADGVERTVLRRFDLLTELVGVDRPRAAGWTLGRVLQNALWEIEDGKAALDPADVALAGVLLRRRG